MPVGDVTRHCSVPVGDVTRHCSVPVGDVTRHCSVPGRTAASPRRESCKLDCFATPTPGTQTDKLQDTNLGVVVHAGDPQRMPDLSLSILTVSVADDQRECPTAGVD